MYLISAIGNLCYEDDRATQTVVDGLALLALISAYDQNADDALDGDMRKKLKGEALKGLLTVARAVYDFAVKLCDRLKSEFGMTATSVGLLTIYFILRKK